MEELLIEEPTKINIDIPAGWISTSIKEVNLRVSSGIDPSKHPEEVFELYSVPSHETGEPEIVKGKEIGSTKQIVKEGDVLISKINPRINRVWRVGSDRGYRQIASSEWIVVETNCIIDTSFLQYLFSEERFRNLLQSEVSGVGGSLTRARPKLVENYPIFIAPLAEQKRIVAKLDALMEKAEAAKERLEAIPETLKQFRQRVLANALSGKLTEAVNKRKNVLSISSPIKIDDDPSGPPEGWKWTRLIDVARLESGHTPRKSVNEYWENGDIPWICLQDIREAHGKTIFETKYMPTQLGIDNSSSRILPAGTVCFSRDISVGFVTIMGKEMATTQHFANWICGKELNNKYLLYAFMAAQMSLISSGQGTTVKTIYMPALNKMQILLPPIDEQQEIVSKVEEIFKWADNVEEIYNRAIEKLERLPQALLAKAFRGELVPQDRFDEPASKLLERIKAERAKQQKGKSRKGV